MLPTMKAICGSMLVNEGFKDFLDKSDKIEREGGIQRLALSLGYQDVTHFKVAASEAFEESCKWDFPLKKKYSLMVESLAPERDAWILSMTA